MFRNCALLVVALIATSCRLYDFRKADYVPVESIPSGAQVLCDGRILGVTPITVTIPRTAPPRITLRLEGHEDLDVEIATLSATLGEDLRGEIPKAEVPILAALKPAK